MRTINKFPIRAAIEMPMGAKIIKVDTQGEQGMFWAEVDTDNFYETRYFDVIGTGWEVPEGLPYVGTYLQGEFVWHIYERFYE